jgi:hypothetical protein
MRIGGVHSAFAKTGPQLSSGADARVRNASGVNGLGDASHGSAADFEDNLAEIDNPKLSHSGTDEFAPLWHGPALRPTFVAQVMGQVMMDHREQAVALTRLAYANNGAAERNGALIDGRI